MTRIRKMRMYQISFLALFIIVLLLSVFSSLIFNLRDVGLYLLLANIGIAIVVAVFGSLSIREEEEEKT